MTPTPMSPSAAGLARRTPISMPDLCSGTHAHRHTLHSALACLEALGVAGHRISVRRVGREALPSGTVARQLPAPGAPLGAEATIRLDIVGLGFAHALPVGMWDSGGEREPGTRELLEGLDDPLEKLRHWFHEGAPLFRLTPEDLSACARWLLLFGIEPSEWPQSLWYRLASVVAKLPELSASEAGVRLVLDILFGLPVTSFRYQRSLAVLGKDAVSALGSHASRLGVDLILSDAVEDLSHLVLEIGPVSLARYQRFAEKGEDAGLLRRALEYLLPAFIDYELRWVVEDRKGSPRLGMAEQNARLGINSHMGLAAGVLA